jgi:esterase/lipase superfamily enzyme
VEVASEKLRPDQAKAQLGSANTFAELQERMRQGRDPLTFIHGYNVEFREALVTGARLADAYGPKLEVVVFSWPSDGSMMPLLAYKRDRTDAAASAPAFARALLKLRDFVHEVRRGNECGQRIHLMAHSMGNYVLRHGLQEVMRHGTVPRVFDQLFLMAADEDDDAFELDHKLRLLPHIGQAVNVYFNRGDTALVISDRTKANPTRLGSRGPREPLNVPAAVTIVDVSEVVGGLVEHDYLVSDKRTVEDVAAVMRGTAHDLVPKRRYIASQNKYVLQA